MALQDIHLPEIILQRWQQAKDCVNTSVHSLTNFAQQASQSLKETATQATDRAIDKATTTLEQAKGSLDQSLQTAEQIKHTTSVALQTAIASPINDWLAQHPLFFRLFHILGWATNHPILSFVILLFIVALLWSIIKAIIRIIETASWKILQVPLKLLQALIQVIYRYLSKFVNLAVQKNKGALPTDKITFLIPEHTPTIFQAKQQRLAEISHRLEAIQKEQNELLQEAADLIAVETVDFKIQEIKFNK
jgi:hypothetical protein